jgi:rubrerythrin
MSKTEENLLTAFTGESKARNKYASYAEIARKEGYRYVARIFDETSENEKFHALEELNLLLGERTTAQNLREAIEAEKYESEEMYPKFAQEAEVEGNRQAEILFVQIAKIEKEHRARFEKLLYMVEDGTVFKREQPIKWKCSICGYTYEGCEPPNRCPYCKSPQEYYEPANLDV